MPPKPRKRPPNAGKRGRKPGTPNRVTGTTREMFSAFVERNAARVQELFDRLARRNPKAALEVLSKFAEFVLPRLERTELDASVSVREDGPPIVIVDAVEAARAYQSIMAGMTDSSRVIFEVPRPEPVAAVAARLPPTP